MKKFLLFTFVILIGLPLFAVLGDSEITVSNVETTTNEDYIWVSISTTELLASWQVSAFQFDLAYDANLLTYVSYENDNLISDGSMIAINDATAGIIQIGCASSAYLTGAGSILDIQFSIDAAGSSALSISDFIFNTTPITNLTNGSVVINEPAPSINVSITEITQTGNGSQTFDISNAGDVASVLNYSLTSGYTALSNNDTPKINVPERGTPHPIYAEVLCYVPAVREEWLSFTPTSGTVNYGATTEINVTFDDTGLEAGDYTANIILASNGGDDVVIPVTFTVIEADDVHPVAITFEAWILERPDEVITETTVGCGYGNPTAAPGYLVVQCGSFASQWNEDETLHIRIVETATGNTANAEIILTTAGYQLFENPIMVTALPPATPIDVQINVTTIVVGHVLREFNWTSVDGASFYNVYSCDSPNGDWIQMNTEPILGTSFSSEGASAKKFFRVTANN